MSLQIHFLFLLKQHFILSILQRTWRNIHERLSPDLFVEYNDLADWDFYDVHTFIRRQLGIWKGNKYNLAIERNLQK